MKQWLEKWKWVVGTFSIIALLIVGATTIGGAIERTINNSDKIKEITKIDKQVTVNTYDIDDLKEEQYELTIEKNKRKIWQAQQEERVNNIRDKLVTMQETVNNKFDQQQTQLNKILDVLLNGRNVITNRGD